jgi:DNA processing protein
MGLDGWVEAIALCGVPRVGDRTFKALVDAYGSPGAALRAGRGALERVGVPNGAAVSGIDWKRCEELAKAIADRGFRLIAYGSPGYPALLSAVADPPALLYCGGTLTPADERAIAIVGSRRASTQGIRFARKMARELAEQGLTVVSGLAHGIDAAAHQGALEGHGRTIAVFGAGLDVVYPGWNAPLAAAVRGSGAWVSEQPLGNPPLAHHFPRRNRIISGLSLGVVVVEAAERSGSLITAQMALDQGREVFAVPGLPGAYQSRGTHNLLRSGAKLVERVEDVLEELPRWGPAAAGRAGSGPAPELPPHLSGLWQALEESPLHIDEVADRSRAQPAETASGLMELCLRGMAEEWPGKRYSRSSTSENEGKGKHV